MPEWQYAERYQRTIDTSEPMIVFGAGKGGEQFYGYWKQKSSIKVMFFVDDDPAKQNTEIAGIPVYNTTKLTEYQEVPVIVACAAWREVAEKLQSLGVQRFYFSDDFGLHAQGPGLKPIIGHFSPQLLREQWPTIEKCASLLADQDSLSIFKNQIRYRLTRHIHHVQQSRFAEYDHPEVRPTPGDSVIDAGAWIGDTAESFALALAGKGHVYSFEPDERNIIQAREMLKSKGLDSQVTLVTAGLSDSNGTLFFTAEADESFASHVDKNGSIRIDVVSLDDYCDKNGIKPTFVKMDIEGSEPPAIEGARHVISDYAPKLIICLYHNPTDLWQLPVRIHELYPDYEFHIGHHSVGFRKCILYALPKKHAS